MTFRAAGRLGWFTFEVLVILLNYLFTTAFAPQKSKRLARAAWLHRSSRRHLKIFGYSADVAGAIPKNGLLVSNHLSYLDILAISATTPAVFVSKADVRRWPLFGWLAALAGTVFVERERRTLVVEVNREIQTALDTGVLVVIFPEGTSSNGETVLPFRTSLLEPAARGGHEIATGWIHYELDDGDAKQEVCYWGDHSFFPHLINLLGNKSVRATIRFGKFERTTADRKELAKQLHAAVLELKTKN
ncbi:MAG TPA: 1-acyl-sn-glycerol-3-phosphate acyltransferase [Verrucomicrobia subdivision 3 bacterium]|nr:1-acyl-sn-glycerol-3-phosphate acyltransferase [Limisphaerales bacterium]